MSDLPTEILLANARHPSVTEKRLTELKGGLTARYLYERPLIEYLEGKEQPHYILAARQSAPTFSGPNPPSWSGQTLQGMAMHMVTDSRWLMVAGMKGGDGHYAVPIEDVVVTDYSTGHSGHEISLLTPEYEIDVPIGNMYDSDEVEALVDYVRGIDGAGEAELREQQSDERSTGPDGTSRSADHSSGTSRSGGHPDGVEMVAEGKNGQVVLFEDKIRISREDIGMLYKLNQLGKGEKEIRLENITSIQLKEPSTLTKGYIQFGQSGYSESDDGAFDAASDENSVLFTQGQTDEFVELREEIEKLKQQDKEAAAAAGSGVDPTEQLKNIKELHDNGVLSDEEFEQKKQDLLDQI